MKYLDTIRRFFTLHPRYCVPLVSLALGYVATSEHTQHGRDNDPSDDVTYTLRRWGARITFGGGDSGALFHNAALFIRVNAPVGVWFGIRFGKLYANKFVQAGIGWKLSGVPGATFRIQTDESAARGTTGPNYGQAINFEDGPK